MIPERFVSEYPVRCLALLDRLEPAARELDLAGTFSIMLASSILTVPLERLRARHPLHGGDHDLAAGLRNMSSRRWVEAEAWADGSPAEWRFARVMGDPNDVMGWRDEHGERSMADAANTIARRRGHEVLRVLRNALAHGNIVYLNEEGHEVAGTRVEWLGFLSRYEETDEQRAQAETYRLVAVREAHFLGFVKAWAGFIARLGLDDDLRVA